MTLLIKIIKTGTTENDGKMSFIEIKLVKLSNIFNLIYVLMSIILIAIVLLLSKDGFQSCIRFILLIPFCFFNITLNYYHRYLLSRILTVFAPFFFIFVFPVFNQFIYSGMFIWFPYGISIVGAVSFFVFSYENEKYWLNASLVFFTTATIFYDKILQHSIPNSLDLSFIYGNNYIYYQVSKIILVCFLYTALYIAKVMLHLDRCAMSDLNRILDQKNNELTYLNQNLEEVVKQRTQKLDLQNNRIKDLAFTNAHVVRASVARIIGLVNHVNENAHSDEDKEFCYIMIRKSALELDIETDKIAQELIEEN